jgi:23S rRNA pseudouridine2605 synthase
MLDRLQKVLAAAGVASRRDAEALILAGRVQVDGQPITTLGTKVDPDRATIQVDGRPITPRPPLLYLALHKPAGYDSTRSDPHAAHTVMELVLPSLEGRYGRGHPSVEGLHPVGRLDRESEGLLLLTNDGSFTHALTHPRYEVTKTYLAEVAGQPAPETLEQLRQGVLIEGRRTAPAEVRLVPRPDRTDGGRIELVLREGRKRQVRRMLSAVGHPVRRLTRTAVGPVTLGSLKLGQYRMLTTAEVDALRAAGAPETPGTKSVARSASKRPAARPPGQSGRPGESARPPRGETSGRTGRPRKL